MFSFTRPTFAAVAMLAGIGYPGFDLMSHNAGYLWSTLFGLKGDPHHSHLGFFHLLSKPTTDVP